MLIQVIYHIPDRPDSTIEIMWNGFDVECFVRFSNTLMRANSAMLFRYRDRIIDSVQPFAMSFVNDSQLLCYLTYRYTPPFCSRQNQVDMDKNMNHPFWSETIDELKRIYVASSILLI